MPIKEKNKIYSAMNYINKNNHFSPAGQSTQMVIWASNESDLDIMNTNEFIYNNSN